MSLDSLRKNIAARPLKINRFELEGFDEPFFLREMDAEAMSAFFEINKDRQSEDSFSVQSAARVIVLHLCNEAGRMEVKPEQRESVAQELIRLRFGEITDLFTACLDVSGLSTEGMEEAEKN